MERFIHQTVALAFVPLGFVRLAWQAVKVTASDFARVDEFVVNFERTWLVGISLLADGTSTTWMQTTNGNVEGWHNKLKRVARKAHPKVCELIEQEQAHTKFSTAQLATGSQPPKRAQEVHCKG